MSLLGYWETLLKQLEAHIARTRLRERHQDVLRQKLQKLKREVMLHHGRWSITLFLSFSRGEGVMSYPFPSLRSRGHFVRHGQFSPALAVNWVCDFAISMGTVLQDLTIWNVRQPYCETLTSHPSYPPYLAIPISSRLCFSCSSGWISSHLLLHE